MVDRSEIPFAPEGQCPICGGHCFTKKERKEQVELAKKIIGEIKQKEAKLKAKMERLMDTYERVRNDHSNYAVIKLRHEVALKLVMVEYLLGIEKSNELRRAKGWKTFDEKSWKEFVLKRVME